MGRSSQMAMLVFWSKTPPFVQPGLVDRKWDSRAVADHVRMDEFDEFIDAC